MLRMERSRDWLAQARRDLEKSRLDLQHGFPSGTPMEYFDETLAREAIDAAGAILRFSSDHLG